MVPQCIVFFLFFFFPPIFAYDKLDKFAICMIVSMILLLGHIIIGGIIGGIIVEVAFHKMTVTDS